MSQIQKNSRSITLDFLFHLSFGDGAADLGTTLAGGETGLAGNGKRALLDNLLALGEDELDVARVGHIGVDLGILEGNAKI
jgi:hypothetical protein